MCCFYTKKNGRSNLAEEINPIMRESNLAEEPVAVVTMHEAFLAKQNGRSHGKMSLLSAPGSVLIKNNAYEVTS